MSAPADAGYRPGDPVTAALARLEAAYALDAAGHQERAAEAAEQARRALCRADPSGDVRVREGAGRCLHLLWTLYSGARHRREQALAVLTEFCAVADRACPQQARPTPPYPDQSRPTPPCAVPPPEALLEEAAEVLGGPEAGPHLLAAADRHRAAGAASPELRCLRKALVLAADGLADPPPAAVIARADALAAATKDTAEQALIDAAAAELLAAGPGPIDEAIMRNERAIAWLAAAPHDDPPSGARPGGATRSDAPHTDSAQHTDSGPLRARLLRARLLRARLLLLSGRAAEAEARARELLAETPARRDWPVAVLIARALLAQGRDEQAAAFMGEHEIEPYDLSHDDHADPDYMIATTLELSRDKGREPT